MLNYIYLMYCNLLWHNLTLTQTSPFFDLITFRYMAMTNGLQYSLPLHIKCGERRAESAFQDLSLSCDEAQNLLGLH